jgi:hypothetical protein
MRMCAAYFLPISDIATGSTNVAQVSEKLSKHGANMESLLPGKVPVREGFGHGDPAMAHWLSLVRRKRLTNAKMNSAIVVPMVAISSDLLLLPTVQRLR